MRKWIKGHKFITFLIIAIVVAVIFLGTAAAADTNGPLSGISSTIFGKIGKPFVAIGKKISNAFYGATHYDDLQAELDKLELENNELKQKLSEQEMNRTELEELRQLEKGLNYVGNNSRKLITCDITSVDGSNWMNVFTINAGSKAGLAEGDVVVYGDGLVGKISSCGADSSKVTTIMDTGINVSFSVRGKSKILGILDDGTGSTMSGFTLDDGAAVAEGDVLVTSGMGTYPEGLVIGTVTRVKYDSEKQIKTITVKPYVSYSAIRKVSVIL